MSERIFKAITSHKGLPLSRPYYACNDGQIYSCRREDDPPKPLKGVLNKATKIYCISLYSPTRKHGVMRNGKLRIVPMPFFIPIHTLIAEAFLPPRPSPRHEINHRNCDRRDNRPENLEWVTNQENITHYRTLFPEAGQGEKNHRHKLTVAAIREIRASTKRSSKSLATKFNVSESTILSVFEGRTWRKVA